MKILLNQNSEPGKPAASSAPGEFPAAAQAVVKGITEAEFNATRLRNQQLRGIAKKAIGLAKDAQTKIAELEDENFRLKQIPQPKHEQAKPELAPEKKTSWLYFED